MLHFRRDISYNVGIIPALNPRDRRVDAIFALQCLGFSGERRNIERVRHIQTGDTLTVAVVEDAAVRVLIDARNAARKAKNFAEADRIRDELAAMGIDLKDAKDSKTGELVTTWEVAR